MSLSKIKKLFDLEYIEDNPVTYAEKSSIDELAEFIKYANHYYHNTDKTLVSDYAYDKVKDILTRRDPSNDVLDEVGAPIDGTKKKVKLPYWMGSMTKVKPGDKKLGRFTKKFPGPYTVPDKLDGISGLICFNYDNKYISIYTRGDGYIGASIDYLASYIELPKIKQKIAVRGEFVIKKSVFAELKKKEKFIYKNPRSFVSGAINHKTPNLKHLRLIDFVAYEMIEPSDKSSKQFQMLSAMGFNVVPYSIFSNITEKQMEKHYMERLELTQYDIDGIIITDNKKHERVSGENPKYSRAFKMDLKQYETKVLDVIWRASKDGLLKPVVLYEPVMIGGNKNVKATCNNGRFVVDNKIGKGAIINIIRTNDVLPKVVGVVKPANKIGYPDVDYAWNNSEVEFVVTDLFNNEEVAIQRLIRFFTTLKIENINEGVIKNLYNCGYLTIDDILLMDLEDFAVLPGFKDKMAKKIYNNIHDVVDSPIALEKLMTASNSFQHGFAEKKLKSIIMAFPYLLEDPPTLDEIITVEGWNTKTAEPFLERLPDFIEFLEEHPYLKIKIGVKSKSSKKSELNNKKIVFTGVRNKKLEEKIEELDGSVTGSISKNTYIVITNDPNGLTSKLNKARDLSIPIMTIEQFCKKFNIKL